MVPSTTSYMILYVLLGILLCGISVPLIRRRVRPNPIYGIRLPKLMHDEVLWYKANEYGGRMLFAAGVAQVILVLVSYCLPALRGNLTAFTLVCLVSLLVPQSIALSKILRYAKSL